MASELHTMAMAAPRDPSEIEGTLLPPDIPVATVVNDGEGVQTTAKGAVAAVPLSHFEYDTTHAANLAATDEEDDLDIPTAPFLPSYDNAQSRERREALAVARGKRSGRIASDQERIDIERNNREIGAIQWHTKKALKQASEEAKRQNAEGVQINQLTLTVAEKNEKSESKQEPMVEGYTAGGGYKIAEYDTSEYKGYEYETSEYKSVYDA